MTPSKVPVAETWAQMEVALKSGLAKECVSPRIMYSTRRLTYASRQRIGISNFTGSILLDLIRSAEIPPTVLQIEHHREPK